MAPSTSGTVMPTMSQVLALSLTYRLIFQILLVPVAAPLVLLLALQACYYVFDEISNQHTILSLLIAWTLVSSVRQYIRQVAPSKPDVEVAMAKLFPYLQIGMVLVSCVFAAHIVTHLEVRLGIQPILRWSPTFTLSFALRASAFAAILGISVLARFVGPPSVMRCSSSPLLEHPLATALRKWMSNFTVDAFLDFIAGPNIQMPGQVTKSPLNDRGNARRLQSPMWTSVLSQLLISTALSAVVAYISILPLFPKIRTDGETPLKISILLACVVATLTQLWQAALDGKKHELDPFRHQSQLFMSSSRILMREAASSLVVPTLLVTGAAIVVPRYYFDVLEDEATSNAWFTTGVALVTGSIVYLYVQAFDEAVRHLLCTHLKSMRKLVKEIADDDSMEDFLDVSLNSILHSDAALVKAIVSPSTFSYQNLERDEIQRNEDAIKTMATTLLTTSSTEEKSAHLEEDILRLSILSSFGRGSRLDETSQPVCELIKCAVQAEETTTTTLSRGEPAVVPLARSFCAYIGGIGEAMCICSSQDGSKAANPWLIPPGAIVCATYAVRAVGRLILHDLSVSTKVLADWRSTHLSILIPTVFTSLHRLETSMVKFVKEQLSDSSDSIGERSHFDLFRNECPDLLPLYQAIAESSRAILEKLKSLEGMRRLDFSVSSECSRWIDHIISNLPIYSHQQLSPRSVVPKVISF